MIRVNVALVVGILSTAVVLINTQYDSRRLYTAVDQEGLRARQLVIEYESLRVQRRAEVAPARVQTVAVTRLKMRAPDPSITEYVSLPATRERQP